MVEEDFKFSNATFLEEMRNIQAWMEAIENAQNRGTNTDDISDLEE